MKEKLQLTDIMADAIGEALSNLHTATIAKVTAVQEKTISVQPVINRAVDGKSITLPQFTKVPPLFMQGGGSYTAHPIAVGDYCLLILTERCFDRWYSGSDFQDPAEFRMHDYRRHSHCRHQSQSRGAYHSKRYPAHRRHEPGRGLY